MRRLPLFLFLAALAACAGSGGESVREIRTKSFLIEYADISDAQAQAFAKEAEQALADVTGYFGKTYSRTIWVRIAEGYSFAVANNRASIITIGANRIRGDAPGPPRLEGRGPTITHEITHLVAASRGKSDRFLDEGLGVFVQEKFKLLGDRSYPNMGRDVHKETVRVQRERGRGYILLADAERIRRETRIDIDRDLAYLQEGSFVRHLIETYGLPKFMEMYEGGSYQTSFGKSFQQLEQDWLAFLATLKIADEWL